MLFVDHESVAVWFSCQHRSRRRWPPEASMRQGNGQPPDIVKYGAPTLAVKATARVSQVRSQSLIGCKRQIISISSPWPCLDCRDGTQAEIHPIPQLSRSHQSGARLCQQLGDRSHTRLACSSGRGRSRPAKEVDRWSSAPPSAAAYIAHHPLLPHDLSVIRS
jgi:hypothetical protein